MFIRALLALYCTAANADELAEPSLAVLPFSSSEMITATEADTLTRLFVAGLINSYAFQVVETNEITSVLEAQKLSTADYTEENIAVEIGRILSAEYIAVGAISQVDGEYYLFTRIINVSTGRTIIADNISTGTMSRLLQESEKLGLSIAESFQKTIENPDRENAALRQESNFAVLDQVQLKNQYRSLTIAGGVFYAIGGAAVAATIVSVINHIQCPDGEQKDLWGGIAIGSGIAGSICAVLASILWMERPVLGEIK